MILTVAEYSDALSVVTVDVVSTGSATERDAMLHDGLLSIARAVTHASYDRGRRVLVDVRVSERPDPFGAQAAVVQATRGLVQSYVREMGERVQPVNVLVSHPWQEDDRELTCGFLADADGGMARGSTFDVREAS